MPATTATAHTPPTVFQTPTYLETYRRHFGRGKVFHHIKATNGEAWLQARGLGARRLEWWGAGIHDVGAAATSNEQAGELWEKLQRLSKLHDAAQLAQVEATSPLVQWARAANWQVLPAEACPVLKLPQTWDEYVKSLGKNMREQIKRYPKRLAKEFKVDYHLAQTPEEVRVGMDDLFRLHGKRWRQRGQTGVLALPSRQKFHRDLCEQLRQRDMLRLWTVRCNDQAVCVLLSYLYDKRCSFFIGGFEPDLMRFSVGTCAFARVLRHAIEQDNAREFDFLRGEEEYKYRLGAINRDYVTLQNFKQGARGTFMQRRLQLEATVMHKIHEKFGAAKKENSTS